MNMITTDANALQVLFLLRQNIQVNLYAEHFLWLWFGM